MISSMTGYGRGESAGGSCKYIAELRSENNRFLELTLRLPKTMVSLEQRMKGLLQQHFTRGRIHLMVSVEGTDDEEQRLIVNSALTRSYYNALFQLKEEFGLPGDITVEVLTRIPNILVFESEEQDLEQEWDLVEPAVTGAIMNLIDMRRAEGEQLRSDLEKRIELLENLVAKIEELAPSRVTEAKLKLAERLKSLGEIDHVDPLRLAMEVGILAERCDVTEECVRFHSHNVLFRDTVRAGGPIGKKLNFLLQEMNREANTIGSKALDATISHLVVQSKEEIEKLREQVQNVE